MATHTGSASGREQHWTAVYKSRAFYGHSALKNRSLQLLLRDKYIVLSILSGSAGRTRTYNPSVNSCWGANIYQLLFLYIECYKSMLYIDL